MLAQAGYDESHPLVFTLLYNTSESHQRIAIAASSNVEEKPRRRGEATEPGVEDDAGYHAYA